MRGVRLHIDMDWLIGQLLAVHNPAFILDRILRADPPTN